MLAALVFLVAALLGLVTISPWQSATRAKAAAAVTYPREVSRITFAAAGDVIPHQPVVQSAAAQNQPAESAQAASASGSKNSAAAASANHGGWDALFASVADVFRGVDYGFVNLETPVAPLHTRGSRPFQFDASINLLLALKFSGIKIVSFANNHVFDQGYAGFNETLGHLREQELPFTGAGLDAQSAWNPVVVEKNGIKVGWLGMTRWLNGGRNPEKDSEPHVAFFPYPDDSGGAPGREEAGVLEAIKSAREQCDFLIVSIHWGIEYAPAPNPKDVDFAHDFLEAGAGLIIGHHPHVLQPIETYLTQDKRNAVIVYSLGNFISNQSRNYVNGLTPDKSGEQRDSILFKFSVIKRDYGAAGMRTELGDVGMLPLWTENNALQVRAGHAKVLVIRPILMDREIPKLQTRVDELQAPGSPLSNEQKRELVQVSAQLQSLKHRRELLLSRTGDDFLIPPPNPPAQANP